AASSGFKSAGAACGAAGCCSRAAATGTDERTQAPIASASTKPLRDFISPQITAAGRGTVSAGGSPLSRGRLNLRLREPVLRLAGQAQIPVARKRLAVGVQCDDRRIARRIAPGGGDLEH